MQEIITVANVKCGGCACTIRESLQSMDNVTDVDVDVAEGRVTVHGEELSRDQLTTILAEIGYPETIAE